MRPRPYIGITGVTTREQSEAIVERIPENPSHCVMIGLLMSGKTIRGEANRWPHRYPTRDMAATVFVRHPHILNLVHFNTKEVPEKLHHDMLTAQALAGPHCDGFQLNIAWPDMNALADYRATLRFENRYVVLQCGEQALASVGHSGRGLARRVREYVRFGLIDYVLVDPSVGVGKEFDINLALDCFHHISEIETIGMGIAGGLSAATLSRLDSIRKHHGNFSIDAEGRLRTPEDELDLAAVREYLDAFFVSQRLTA